MKEKGNKTLRTNYFCGFIVLTPTSSPADVFGDYDVINAYIRTYTRSFTPAKLHDKVDKGTEIPHETKCILEKSLQTMSREKQKNKMKYI